MSIQLDVDPSRKSCFLKVNFASNSNNLTVLNTIPRLGPFNKSQALARFPGRRLFSSQQKQALLLSHQTVVGCISHAVNLYNIRFLMNDCKSYKQAQFFRDISESFQRFCTHLKGNYLVLLSVVWYTNVSDNVTAEGDIRSAFLESFHKNDNFIF